MLIKHEWKQIWISFENVLSLYYKEETTPFPPFFGPKMAKMTSKVGEISSKVGETIFDVVSPMSYVLIFTLNFALKTSTFEEKTTFLKKMRVCKAD